VSHARGVSRAGAEAGPAELQVPGDLLPEAMG
jgi:hypothetical protein